MGLNTPHGIQASQVLPEEVIANLAAWAAQILFGQLLKPREI